MHAEPLALADHRLQRAYHRPCGRAPGGAERGLHQRVQIVHDHHQTGQRRCRLHLLTRRRRRAQPDRRTRRRVQVPGTRRAALGDDPPRHLVPRVPLDEADPAQQLGPPLQLRAQRLRELPHPDRVVGGEMRGHMRYVRADPQALAVPASPGGGAPGAHAVPAVHQHDAEPVRTLGGGQRRDDRPQQLRTPAARRALDQQMRPLGGEVRGDRPARPCPEHRPGPPAQRVLVVTGVRPTRQQRRRGGPGQPQLVQQARRLGQRRGHTRVPLVRGTVRPQRGERPCEPLGPREGDGVHGGDRAVAHGAGAGGVDVGCAGAGRLRTG